MVTTTQTINNVPSDGVPVIEVPFVVNVSWQTYQALLADMGEHRAARLAYNRRILEIKMPSRSDRAI